MKALNHHTLPDMGLAYNPTLLRLRWDVFGHFRLHVFFFFFCIKLDILGNKDQNVVR